MDELENKKWIITRIDRTFQMYEDFLKKVKKTLVNLLIKKLKNT